MPGLGEDIQALYLLNLDNLERKPFKMLKVDLRCLDRNPHPFPESLDTQVTILTYEVGRVSLSEY